MSEFFLELFSEEIPSSLQKSLREDLLNNFIKVFNEKSISFKESSSFSTPNRLVILFEGLQKKISLPAYDQCLKASHIFNILDARGAISVAQRAGYIGRIRDITKATAGVWLDSQS